MWILASKAMTVSEQYLVWSAATSPGMSWNKSIYQPFFQMEWG